MAITSRARTYELRVHKRGVNELTDSTVDFVINSDDFASVPSVGSKDVRPLQGKVVTTPWNFQVDDTNEFLTSKLSDSGGRFDIIGRVVEVRLSENGGPFNVIGTGRISNISLNENVGSYNIEVSDEHWKARNTEVFTETNTTVLYPPGPRFPWRTFRLFNINGDIAAQENVDLRSWASAYIANKDGNFKEIKVRNIWGFPSEVRNFIEDDLKDDAEIRRTDGKGNFHTLKARIFAGHPLDPPFEERFIDFEVITFDKLDSETFTSDLKNLSTDDANEFNFWVYDPNDDLLLSTGGTLDVVPIYLHAPSAGPSDGTPLHIALDEDPNSAGDPKFPNHPYPFTNIWDLVTHLYDIAGVRYDQQAFDDLKNSGRYPDLSFRITEPHTLADWLSENIYAPLLVTPFINDNGEISPRPVELPSTDSSDPLSIDPATLFEFDKTNLVEHPTFDHTSRDLINRIVFGGKIHYQALYTANPNIIEPGFNRPDKTEGRSGDRLSEHDKKIEKEYDNIDVIGPQETDFNMSGFRADNEGPSTFWVTTPTFGGTDTIDDYARLESFARVISENVFERFGDGPVRGILKSTYAADSVTAGDWVKINLSSYPTGQSGGARGNLRIVQILTKTRHADHIEFTYLDAGPDLQPLATPTVSIAKTTSNPRHSVDVTVSGVPSGATAIVQLGYGATEPTKWIYEFRNVENETITVPDHPSGMKVWARAMSTQKGRIRSGWSTVVSVTLDSITAPTLNSTTVDGGSIIQTFTPGNSNYRIMPVLAETPNTPKNYIGAPIPGSSDFFSFDALKLSTQYEVGVKHVDKFGGESAAATTTATTAATGNQLVAPRYLRFRQARGTGDVETEDDMPPDSRLIGYGFHIKWSPYEPYSIITIQVSTDQTFSTVDEEFFVESGVDEKFIFLGALDSTIRHVRIRHERQGYQASPWSGVISAKPGPLVANPGPDRFAGGFALLRPRGENVEIVLDDTDDPDTDKIFYDVAINPASFDAYPTVDENSTVKDNTQLPFVGLLQSGGGDYTANPGDLFLLTARFWNRVAGFGQTSRFPLVMPRDQFIDARPVLDEDTGDLYLYPNRTANTQSIKYLVKTDGTIPTKSEVDTSGTLSTADEIQIHTFTQDKETAIVGVVGYDNNDGTGTSSNVIIRRWTYNAADDRPVTSIDRLPDTSGGQTQIVITGRDDSNAVALYYRTYDEGTSAPSYTRDPASGTTTDPHVVEIGFDVPPEGGTAKIVEAYSEDGNGNITKNPVRLKVVGPYRAIEGSVFVDDLQANPVFRCSYGDEVNQIQITTPSGTFTFDQTELTNGNGLVTYTVGVDTLDDGTTIENPLTTGERRAYTIVYSAHGLTATKFDGNAFGPGTGEADSGLGLKIQGQWILEPPGPWKRRYTVNFGPNVESIGVDWSYTDASLGAGEGDSFTIDTDPSVTPRQVSFFVQSSGGTTHDFATDDTDLIVDFIAYAGDNRSGSQAPTVQDEASDPPEEGGGTAFDVSGVRVVSDEAVPGFGIEFDQDSNNKPRAKAKPADFIVVSASEPASPVEGMIWVDTS